MALPANPLPHERSDSTKEFDKKYNKFTSIADELANRYHEKMSNGQNYEDPDSSDDKK